MINTDKPINSIDEDKLGRHSFVRQLAKAICEYNSSDNYAISLQGKWGCGKTSILNMIVNEINDLTKDIIIVRFNPWNFTDGNQLISQFFMQLSTELKAQSKNTEIRKIKNNEKIAKIGELIEDYSYALEYTEYIPVVGKYLKFLPQLANTFGRKSKDRANSNANNILFQKNAVIEGLKNSQSRILIIVDDIDRLPNEQIRLIFQLVSSVAGFPNTTYLLSYDKEVVVRALGKIQCCDGEEYLEKIIQVSFDVPLVNSAKLYNVFVDKIDNMIDISNEEFETMYWNSVYNLCIAPFIRSVRDINRYVNMLSFSYISLKNEINFFDMAALCAFRTFAQPIYEWIKNNKFTLIGGYNEGGISLNDIEKRKNEYIEIFKEVYPKNPEIMFHAIAILFPSFNNRISANTIWDSPLDLYKSLRIASKERFDVYFSLSLEDVKISHSELNSSILKMNESELRTFITMIIERGLIEEYMSELKLYLKEIPEDRVELLLSVLIFTSGIINDESELCGYNDRFIGVYLLIDFLNIISDENKRFLDIRKLFEKSDFTSFQKLLHLLHIIELSYGKIRTTKHKEGPKLISIEQLNLIEGIVLERIKKYTISVSIFDWAECKRALMLWQLIDKKTYFKYVFSQICNPIYAIVFASLSIGEWRSGSRVEEYELNTSEYYNYMDFFSNEDLFRYIEQERKQSDFWKLDEKIIRKSIAMSIIISDNSTKNVDCKNVEDKLIEWKAELN